MVDLEDNMVTFEVGVICAIWQLFLPVTGMSQEWHERWLLLLLLRLVGSACRAAPPV